MISNKLFSLEFSFQEACREATDLLKLKNPITATKRQASKFRLKKGSVYKAISFVRRNKLTELSEREERR